MATIMESFRTHLIETESPHTVRKYFVDARDFEIFRGGETISVPLVERWARAFNGRLNPATVERKLAAVRRWLAFRAAGGDEDSVRVLTILHGGYQVVRGAKERDRRIVEPVSAEEFADAMERARQWRCEWMQALMGVLWYSGPRISEVVGDAVAGIPCLTVSDGQSLIDTGYVQIVGKGAKRRWLVLPSSGQNILRSWAHNRRMWAEDAGGQSAAESAPLFASSMHPQRAVSMSLVNLRLHEYGVNSAHRFRHSYRVRLRRAGVNDEIVRALMGHGPATISESYGRVSLEEMREAAELLTKEKIGGNPRKTGEEEHP